jgi:hypothetical protein
MIDNKTLHKILKKIQEKFESNYVIKNMIAVNF